MTKISTEVLINNKSVQNSAQLRKLLRLFPLFYKKNNVFFCSTFCSIVLNKSTGLFKIGNLSEHLSHFLTWHAPFFWTFFFVTCSDHIFWLDTLLFSEHFFLWLVQNSDVFPSVIVSIFFHFFGKYHGPVKFSEHFFCHFVQIIP